jgi:glycosyltransferase involved in cell wall biosynthesis
MAADSSPVPRLVSGRRLRVLWVHNFDPGVPVSGVFMHKLADAVQASGVDVDMLYTGKLSRPLEIWRARAQLRWLAPQFDLVHMQYGSMCAWIGTVSSGPRLLSLRGSDWYSTEAGPWADRLHGFLANRLTRHSMGRYEQVICMSDRMKREIAEYFRKRGVAGPPVRVLTDGLSLHDFRPMPRAQCRTALGFDGDQRPWVLVTTLDEANPIKRVGLARAAVEAAQAVIPDLQLRIASGIAHADMPTWVNACNVTLMTSLHEGWPNAIKESLACDVPFVATDISDLPMIAQGDDSCMIAPADPQALGQAIVDSLRKSGSGRLRSQVQHMDLAQVARELRDAYFDMLERPCVA